MLYDTDHLRHFSQVTFTPGQQGTATPFGGYDSLAIHATAKWELDPGAIDQSGDYGLITVQPPIGNKTGWFGLRPADPYAPAGTTVETAGYPVDLDPTATHLFDTSGSVVGQSFDLATDLDAYHGQSGSPIWENTAQGPYAVAVLHGLPTNPGLDVRGSNGLVYPLLGAPVTSAMLDQIAIWEAEDNRTIAQQPQGAYVDGVDAEYYLAHNPDVAAVARVASPADPDAFAIAHYEQFGWKEGRNANPLFDEGYYLASNPDVLRAGINPLLHYELFGWKEARTPSPAFAGSDYLVKNQDVARAGINPLDHYLLNGIRERRQV